MQDRTQNKYYWLCLICRVQSINKLKYNLNVTTTTTSWQKQIILLLPKYDKSAIVSTASWQHQSKIRFATFISWIITKFLITQHVLNWGWDKHRFGSFFDKWFALYWKMIKFKYEMSPLSKQPRVNVVLPSYRWLHKKKIWACK